MTNQQGNIVETSALDNVLHEYLIRMFEEGKTFPPEIKTVEDITDRFSVFRSLRRASDTRALNQGVSEADIDIVNRWKKVERGKGKKSLGSMRQHYAEFTHLVKPFLRYTKAM